MKPKSTTQEGKSLEVSIWDILAQNLQRHLRPHTPGTAHPLNQHCHLLVAFENSNNSLLEWASPSF